MKVALIVPGGVDRSGKYRVIPCLLWLIERLARDHELHVFALRQEPLRSNYPLLGAIVHNIGSRPRRPRALAAILREHRRGPFDLLHAIWAAPQGIIAGVAGRLMRRPVLLHLTGGDLTNLPDIGYGLLINRRGRVRLRLASTAASRITVPSAAMHHCARELGIGAERLTYGVALNRWKILAPRYRNPDRPARLLHVGTLNRVKDPITLLRAMAHLAAMDLSFRLDVVGEDLLRGKMQRFATELGIRDLVHFHGFLPHQDLRPLVERANLLLVSSRHEADPIVVLEAAVAGVPALGTSVGHVAEWSPDAAVAVAVGDSAALAREAFSLLMNEKRRMRLAAAAQALAIDWNADRTAQHVSRIYNQLCQ